MSSATTATSILESNFLSPGKFVFVIDTPKLENISYHCQTVSIPTITVESINVPYRQFNPKMTGTGIEYSPFDAKFIIDEDMHNYIALYDWIFNSVTKSVDENFKKTDVILMVYNNNNNLQTRIHMMSAFPTSLSPIEFTVTNAATTYLYADVSFSFDWLEFRN